MARLQTGSTAGLHLELVSDGLEQHKRMTDMDAACEEAVRRVLADALAKIVQLVGDDGWARPNAPHELD